MSGNKIKLVVLLFALTYSLAFQAVASSPIINISEGESFYSVRNSGIALQEGSIFTLITSTLLHIFSTENTLTGTGLFVLALILINLFTAILYAYDKFCAMNGKWRVPENVLLTSAAAGGSLGAYLAMMTLRHKTRKKAFQIAIPVFFIIQTIILLIIF